MKRSIFFGFLLICISSFAHAQVATISNEYFLEVPTSFVAIGTIISLHSSDHSPLLQPGAMTGRKFGEGPNNFCQFNAAIGYELKKTGVPYSSNLKVIGNGPAFHDYLDGKATSTELVFITEAADYVRLDCRHSNPEGPRFLNPIFPVERLSPFGHRAHGFPDELLAGELLALLSHPLQF